MLPELVIADTELFVKTLSDVVSDVLSQPTLLSPDGAPSSNKPDKRVSQDFQVGELQKFLYVSTFLYQHRISKNSMIVKPVNLRLMFRFTSCLHLNC